MFVFGCVQKLAFFYLRLNFWVLAHDCDQDERKCDQKNGTRARLEKFCDWHRKDFSSPDDRWRSDVSSSDQGVSASSPGAPPQINLCSACCAAIFQVELPMLPTNSKIALSRVLFFYIHRRTDALRAPSSTGNNRTRSVHGCTSTVGAGKLGKYAWEGDWRKMDRATEGGRLISSH